MLYSWHIIGERIRKNRKSLGLSQEQFAEKISQTTHKPLKRQTVAGWENGEPVKKLEQLLAMCNLFQCDMSYLLCECDTKRLASQSLSQTLGLSERAIDTLITASHNGHPMLSVLSDLIEDSSDILNSTESEDADCFSVIEQIAAAASINYGSGSCAHGAEFIDAFTNRKNGFYVTPRDIYRNMLHSIHKGIDSFIKKRREKAGLPDYD